MQLWYALRGGIGDAIPIVGSVELLGCGGAGLLRDVNYGRYHPVFIYRGHYWVVGKRCYRETSSRFTQPWYAPRVAMGGMFAMVARIVVFRCGDEGSLGSKVNHCRRQPGMEYWVYYWTAREYLSLHA